MDILWLLNYDISKYSEMGKCLHVPDLHRKGLLHTHHEHGNARPAVFMVVQSYSLSKLTDKSCEGELVNGEMCSSGVEIQVLLHNSGNGRSQEEIKTSIFKVPPLILNNKKEAYEPRVVSFGPYHHEKSHLALMEAQKQHTLQRFIDRVQRPRQEVFDFIREVAEELKDSYDSLDLEWKNDTDKFVELMVLDGCFMLEILQSSYKSDYDPVFSEHAAVYVFPLIRHDMLLLENQLPMLLLHRLNNIENDEPGIEDLNKDILRFLFFCNEEYPTMGSRCLHVLDLFRKVLLHQGNESLNQEERKESPWKRFSNWMSNMPKLIQRVTKESPWKRFISESLMTEDKKTINQVINFLPDRTIRESNGLIVPKNKKTVQATELHNVGVHSVRSKSNRLLDIILKDKKSGHNVVRPATELHNAGVHFEKSKSNSLLDITFDDNNGFLRLPNVVVDDYTESMFLNLLAFERCHIRTSASDITSFIAFMDCIIDDSRDIELLSSKGIIDRCIGTDKEAADLFNTMSKNSIIWNNKLYKVYRNLVAYNKMPSSKWRANLIRTYSKSPGAIIISVFAFFLLFYLTFVQTIFTIIK